ncbi:MAG: hypothetical protein ABL904_24965 [Hyphomicrobiaceae bacterium]
MHITGAAAANEFRNLCQRQLTLERLSAAVGILGLALVCFGAATEWASDEPLPAIAQGIDSLAHESVADRPRAPMSARPAGNVTGSGREIMAGGYLGMTYTRPSTVTITNPGRTAMTVGGVDWVGLPFKSPIYYGARIAHWPAAARFGTLLDFTHAKAIAPADDEVTLTGTHDGKALPPRAKVGDIFKHFEFSHGHNMLTLNALTRLGFFRIQPYAGVGAGISLPHTEIGFRSENGRTYEYQYAGLVGQALAGLEIRLGGASVFLEYKLSYSPYDVPLSGVVNGWLLVTDVWRQFKAWLAREAPPGGRLSTPLLTHHGIGGVMVRVTAAQAAGSP